MNSPITKALSDLPRQDDLPEITSVHYDLWKLRLSLEFEDGYEIIVIFDAPSGFRVLDEGDLVEFWEPEARVKGYIWEVRAGGWLDLERTRQGFLSGQVEDQREFLVAGMNDCVSVITSSTPTIEFPQGR